MRRSVDLSKQATVNKQGKRYVYWVIRWYDAAGKRRSQHLGRADQLSKRQAENLRRQKEAELRSNPVRRNISTRTDPRVLPRVLLRGQSDRAGSRFVGVAPPDRSISAGVLRVGSEAG